MDEPPNRLSGTPEWSDVDAHRHATRAADALASVTGVPHHDVVVVLGTGLAAAADQLGPARSRHPLDVLPGMPSSFVSHQTSEFRSLDVEGTRVLVFLGRLHLYEGYSPAQVVHAVRTAVAAGCSTVLLTNASGSLRPELRTGSLALVADHLNLTGRSPLSADPGAPRLPTPFVDLVGMSSVLEAIAARQLGAEVLGLSLVTNMAAGMEHEEISPGDIIGVGEDRAAHVGRLVGELVRNL